MVKMWGLITFNPVKEAPSLLLGRKKRLGAGGLCSLICISMVLATGVTVQQFGQLILQVGYHGGFIVNLPLSKYPHTAGWRFKKEKRQKRSLQSTVLWYVFSNSFWLWLLSRTARDHQGASWEPGCASPQGGQAGGPSCRWPSSRWLWGCMTGPASPVTKKNVVSNSHTHM